MGIDRRGFLAGMLALGAAPAIVRAESLMPVKARPLNAADAVWTPVGAHGLIAPITMALYSPHHSVQLGDVIRLKMFGEWKTFHVGRVTVNTYEIE